MKLVLVDQDHLLVNHWKKEFAPWSEVDVAAGNILSLAHNAIVSPANGYGIMDGGIDLLYLQYFGMGVQDRVLDAISRRQEGYLPVGASVVVKTDDPKIQYLVVAPTMLVPEQVSPANAFFAMSAALRAASNTAGIRHLYCPGLGTGTGQIPPESAATEMANAYRKWRAGSQASISRS